MSAGSIPSSPTRAAPQVSRSINERVSGSSRHTPSSSYHHRHITGHISSTLHRLDRNRDERNGSVPASTPAMQQLQHRQQVTPRASLEASRLEATFSGGLSPGQSRTASVLIPPGSDVLGIRQGGVSGKEEQLLMEQRKTEARTAGFKKSLSEMNTFSTMTTRRLDETYYNVLEKLTTLQNTIVALKDLAQASTTTNEGFVAESQAVITEAQAQLDGFGDFTEQQRRVQALQDRVLGGRERIAALSARVDVVRQRVEKWERADREWQERTRRRLKIMWGVLFGLGLIVLVLSWGARVYGPDIGEVVGELQHDALVAKTKLENRVTEVGLGKADSKGNDSIKLNFSGGGTAEQSTGDEVLRALDEL
ncbi:hypothetical protein N0V82_002589 [Gnomoniopsis sp. IMI 355080]|nr:hypothetical protein N0V82_002589 [Gnomoniopsis sp. IMI 355080]